mmetsp:Transcript_13263/g.34009  ORF Transcript_13263/g.34009 Transcript_13263/m.34009 type:complete len:261 (-) Transcript_13263:618-1400(-)
MSGSFASASAGVVKIATRPLAPWRPVRPAMCTKESTEGGMPSTSTRSTAGRSRPRAPLGEATRTRGEAAFEIGPAEAAAVAADDAASGALDSRTAVSSANASRPADFRSWISACKLRPAAMKRRGAVAASTRSTSFTAPRTLLASLVTTVTLMEEGRPTARPNGRRSLASSPLLIASPSPLVVPAASAAPASIGASSPPRTTSIVRPSHKEETMRRSGRPTVAEAARTCRPSPRVAQSCSRISAPSFGFSSRSMRSLCVA